MPRVLVAPETANLAETTRMVEVSRALQQRGHEVLVFGYSRRYAGLVEEAGLPWRPMSPEFTDREAELMLAADRGRSLRHPFTPELVEQRVAAERELIGEFAPDVLLTGSNLTALASSRIAGVATAYVKPFALSGPHLAASPGGRLMRRLPVLPAGFRRVSRRHSLGVRSLLDLLEADLNLVTSMAWELAGGPWTLPADHVPVGPISARLPGELPRVVGELHDDPRPLVYAALGSSASRGLALAVLTALGRAPVSVVAPLADYLSADDLRGLPDNVHVTGLLPAHLLGGVADAAVIHGGEGTVQTAGLCGLPFIGVPLQREQAFNVDQRVRWGCAIRFSPGQVRRAAGSSHPGRFDRALDRVLHDDAMRVAADDVARRYAGVDGAAEAAKAVEELVLRS